jgi:hypothetical protein
MSVGPFSVCRMVINCSQCEFRGAACADCLVTVQVKDNTAGNAHYALGAQELRALGVLASAGLVPPLRYKPAQVSETRNAIVALSSRARVVIGETGATLAEALETAKCFHYGLIPVTPPDLRTMCSGHSLSARPGGERI